MMLCSRFVIFDDNEYDNNEDLVFGSLITVVTVVTVVTVGSC